MFWAVLGCVVLTGILAGTVWEAYARSSQNAYAGYFVQQYLERYEFASLAAVLKAVLWPALLPLLFLVFNGFSCIGFPLVLFVPLLKGFSVGSVSGYLYATHGLHGMAAVLVLFFLPQILQIWAVLILTHAAADASLGLALQHFSGRTMNAPARMGRMMRAFAQAFLLTVFSCVLESTLSVVFAPVLLG